MNRHGTSAWGCKVWSGAMVAGMLLLAAGRAEMAALPWAAGVVVLLALADAGQVVMARVFTDAYNRFMQKLSLNGGNVMNPSTNAQGNRAEEFVLPAPVLGWRQAGQVCAALGSFSVWPFYGALLALVVGFHVQTAARGGDGERGRVGESARLLPSAATGVARPQPVVQSPQPAASKPPTVLTPTQPRQNPPGSQPFPPSKTSPVQPAVRFPIAPSTRLPQNGVPQNGVPQNDPPQNPAVPNGAPPNP